MAGISHGELQRQPTRHRWASVLFEVRLVDGVGGCKRFPCKRRKRVRQPANTMVWSDRLPSASGPDPAASDRVMPLRPRKCLTYYLRRSFDYMLAKVVSTGVVLIWNFGARKSVIFP